MNKHPEITKVVLDPNSNMLTQAKVAAVALTGDRPATFNVFEAEDGRKSRFIVTWGKSSIHVWPQP